jgi:hypothetical protein
MEQLGLLLHHAIEILRWCLVGSLGQRSTNNIVLRSGSHMQRGIGIGQVIDEDKSPVRE